MGTTGNSRKKKNNELVNRPVSEAEKYTDFGDGKGATPWFNNEVNSNYSDWKNTLSESELSAVRSYIGIGYRDINDGLYTTPWKDMDADTKKKASNIYNAMMRFELKRGVQLTRQCDFQIFGAEKYGSMSVNDVKNYVSQQNGYLQTNGFLSAGADNTGTPVAGSGVVLHIKVPPSKGAGTFIKQWGLPTENEFLMNSNAVWHVNTNSIKKIGSKVHVEMEWVGQAKEQKFR